MKAHRLILIISIFCFGVLNGFGQLDYIPNAKFELWKSGSPTDWGTSNSIAAGGVTQAIGADIIGTNTIVLTTINVPVTGNIVGTAISKGAITSIANGINEFSGGFKFREHAQGLTGVCKYTAAGIGDKPNIAVILTKWIPATRFKTAYRDTLATGQLQPTNSTYANFYVPLDYSKSKGKAIAPDSAQIILTSSSLSGTIAGSQFFVDSLDFDYGCDLDPAIKTSGGRMKSLPLSTDTIFLTSGQSYSKTWTLYLPRDLTSPVTATLDSLKIDRSAVTTTGLGASYTITTNWPNNMIGAGTIACVTLSGTLPASPATGMGSAAINPYIWGDSQSYGKLDGIQSPRDPDPTPIKISKPIILDMVTSLASKTNVSGCGQSDGSATVSVTSSNGPYHYSWTPTGGSNTTANGLSPGTYTCTISDSQQTKTEIVSIAVQAPAYTPICLVTVDSTSSYNIITWDKSSVVCDSFVLYKIDTLNTYSVMATIPYDSASAYYDHTVIPDSSSAKYAIKAINTCGLESAVSDYHKSIFLQVLSGGNLLWTLYDIENQNNPVTNYKVYRDDSGTGNFLPINSSVPGNASVFAVTDYAQYPNAVYYVEAIWNLSCTANSFVKTTRSNHAQKIIPPVIPVLDMSSSISSKTDESSCGKNDGSATVSVTSSNGPPFSFSWAPSGGNGARATNLTAGTYTCTIADPMQTQTVTVTINTLKPSDAPICFVTVDSTFTHTLVIWEKANIVCDSFVVYRIDSLNVYSKIATVAYDSSSVHHDFTADPNVYSYKYAIKTIDQCGLQSDTSDYHKTIYLKILPGGNLLWTLYEIENKSNPVINYQVYRDNNNTGNFLSLSSSIPGNSTTCTDVNFAQFPNARYYVEAIRNMNCPASGSINTSRSNIIEALLTTGISQHRSENEIRIYPNPASKNITIMLSEFIVNSTITIVNSLAETVYNESMLSNIKMINIENFSKGIYTVIVKNNAGVAVEKLIIN